MTPNIEGVFICVCMCVVVWFGGAILLLLSVQLGFYCYLATVKWWFSIGWVSSCSSSLSLLGDFPLCPLQLRGDLTSRIAYNSGNQETSDIYIYVSRSVPIFLISKKVGLASIRMFYLEETLEIILLRGV